MKAIDFSVELNDYLLDKDRKISNKCLNETCKIYQKEKTCRYIFLSKHGYCCLKRTKIKSEIDRLVDGGNTVAKGDNCNGLGKNM